MQNYSSALQNRVKTLGAQFEAAKAKVNDLSEKLNKATESSGANSEETQKLAAQFSKAQQEAARLGRQLDAASKETEEAQKKLKALKKSVDGVADSTEEASGTTTDYAAVLGKLGEKASSIADILEKGISKTANVISAAVSAASAGVVALTKAAVEEYANYEQLVGGVDTLFGESSQKVQQYAAEAYQKQGLSANDYMETVTSFSASLLQSLENDTEAAAEYADMAITDMSDNANKMGSSMESIQNAYSGFAKQNYTMLDNLKLGYGGTKEEMERLLKDADALSAEFNLLEDENDDLVYSYADIVDAIHIVQTNMGITGTTAKEASTTIQGSVGSAKAAWHNLLIGIADDNQDFDKLVDDFVDSIFTAADNILPRISTSLDGILKLVNKVASQILPTVIQEISAQLPSLIETGAEIVVALGEGITDNLDSILAAAEKVIQKVIPKLAEAFQNIVPKIANSAKKIIKELDGVAEIVVGLYAAFKSLTKGNWIGVGIGLAVSAFGALRKAVAEAEEKAYKAIVKLTDAQWDLIEAAEETAEALDTCLSIRNDNIGTIEIETRETKKLWKELQSLVDANGKVIKGNEDRVDYILNELNDALDTEYKRNGDIIAQYQQMQDEVENLIQMRQAEKLLENGEEAYDTALGNRDVQLAAADAAWDAVVNAESEVQSATERYNAAEKAYYENTDPGQDNALYEAYQDAYTDLSIAEDALDQAEADYDAAIEAANNTVRTITQYELAYTAFAEGRYQDAAALMTQDTAYYWRHIKDINDITEEELESLETEIFAKQSAVDMARKQYLAGNEWFTKELVAGMEEELAELAEIWEEATGEAYDMGTNVAFGLSAGIKSGLPRVMDAAKAVTRAALDAMKDVAQIASPSKITRQFGRFLGEGLGLGMSDESAAVSQRASEMIGMATGTIGAKAVSNTGESTVSAPLAINIEVHADTDDLGSRIARELQEALDDVLTARGNFYRNGRTGYVY